MAKLVKISELLKVINKMIKEYDRKPNVWEKILDGGITNRNVVVTLRLLKKRLSKEFK